MTQHLFNEQAEDDYEQLRVNEDYARRFEHNKRREELHRLQEKHPEEAARLARKAALKAAKEAKGARGDDVQFTEEEGSESSSEEEEEEDLEDDTDKVLETLVRIKRHDPVIYEKDTVLFPQQQLDEADEEITAGNNSKKSSKPVFLRTVLAQQALEGAADDEDAAAAVPGGPVSGSYASEQAALKAAFLAAADEADAALQEGGLVARKAAAAAAAAPRDDPASGQHKEKDMNKLLSEYFGPDDAALDPADAFLKSYLASKAWKQPANGSSASKLRLQDFAASSSDDESDGDNADARAAVGDEEDEEFLEQVDRFEAAYNFRYEEPGAAKIQSFPRVIADSVRRKDDRRKRARDAKAARETEEKAAREAELRRLKNLKKEEIHNMVSRIQREAGIKADAAADGSGDGDVDAVLADLLEGDFDPEEYDKRMAAAFSDSYYQGSDDADELFGDGEEELADEGDLEQPAGAFAADSAQQQQADGFAALRQKQQQQQQQQEEDAQAMAEQRGQLQRLLEDYYKLDYEDNIGGLPCRFRYRQVEAENFGLSADDVLTLSDKQLNSVVGLKLLAPYRDAHKKLRPNYKALQELKGEAAAAAARRQSRKDKKRNRQSEGAPVESLPAADGEQHAPESMQYQEGQQQEQVQQQQQQQRAKQQPRQHDGVHHHTSKAMKHQAKQNKKQKQQTPAELTAEEKQAARLASYAKLTLKPNKEQQQKLDSGRASGSKNPKKKRKLNTGDEEQQQQPPQPGRLANVQLARPLTKAQKKNLLRALKRKEKQQQEGEH